MADFMTEIDKKLKKNGLKTTREGNNVTVQGSKNATPQDVPEPSGAAASKGYKPEELGSGIRVDGKPVKPEKKMAPGGMTASSRAKDKNEDENKEFSRGKRALGAVMAVPGAISGATLLGAQPDFPVYDSGKYGAKLMLAKNKKEEREAGEELESAVKLRKSQKRQADTGEKTNPMGDTYKKGGMTASSRADGCCTKGKTRGMMR